MIDPAQFLEITSAKTKFDDRSRNNVLGFIDENFDPSRYPQEKPRVMIPGQPLSSKGYTCLGSYFPRPGERVLMIPVGTSDYVIVGSIDVSTPVIQPGTTVWEARYPGGQAISSGGSGNAVSWDIVDLDLVGSEQNRTAATRFMPRVPGWYSFGASVMFTGAAGGSRSLVLNYNGTGNTFNWVQLPASAGVTFGITCPPVTKFFNGSTDYAFTTARQNQSGGGDLTLTNTNGGGIFYAVYQGLELPEENSG